MTSVDGIINEIRHYFAEKAGPDAKAVIGISGGKDSTIAAGLLVMALGKDRVYGVMMPNGKQNDIDDAKTVCEILGIGNTTIPIDMAYKAIISYLPTINKQVATNLPARLRMSTLYAVAATLPGGGRVINTTNKSELYIGYNTKYGDLAGDYGLFINFYFTEVIEIGHYLEDKLGIPSYLIDKAPADGMSGLSDEEALGFTYKELDDYLMHDITPSCKTLNKIYTRHKLAEHKVNAIRIPHVKYVWNF